VSLVYDTRALRPQRDPRGPLLAPADDRMLGVRLKLERAQALCDAGRVDEGASLLAEATPIALGQPQLAYRAHIVEGWVALVKGRLEEGLLAFQHARELSEGPAFGDRDRAEALMRLGACQHRRSANSTAIALLTLSLELCDRSNELTDWIRAHALLWRARCYQRQREWEAARADVEHALELATSLGDDHSVAHAYFLASVTAERQGQWLLARYYAEEAHDLYVNVDDRINVARLTNNSGGLLFLLGRPEDAARYLERAHRLALEAGSDADAAQALSSLAQVHLRCGEHAAAEQEARTALAILEGRRDFLDEIGNAQLVLGRALLEQQRLEEAGTWFDAAEVAFDELDSTSHRAAAWVAQGDLARRAGDPDRAATLFRRAADALQDFHF
jgi:tetratricopeptide (TPR) repeat protein